MGLPLVPWSLLVLPQCHLDDIGNVLGSRRILWMARDRWVEKLRCPNCRKAGIARLSTTDEFSWEIRMDGVPEGFKVVRSESSSNFYCSSCDRPVEP